MLGFLMGASMEKIRITECIGIVWSITSAHDFCYGDEKMV
jgi:hypothetical protein